MSPTVEKSFGLLMVAIQNKSADEARSVLQAHAGHDDEIKAILGRREITSLFTAFMLACKSDSRECMQVLLESAVAADAGKTEMKKYLLTTPAKNGANPLAAVSIFASDVDTVKFVIDQLVEVGETELLKNQMLEVPDDNFLYYICSQPQTAEKVSFLLDKVAEVLGDAHLHFQLAAPNEDDKMYVFAVACRASASVELLELLWDRVVKVCGFEDMKRQFVLEELPGYTCLTAVIENKVSTAECVKFIVDKMINELGGLPVLKNFLAVKTRAGGMTCLMFACLRSATTEKLKVVIDSVIKAGGNQFLEDVLVAERNDEGLTPLMLLCHNTVASDSSSLKLLTDKILEFGGELNLAMELGAETPAGRNCLQLILQFSESRDAISFLIDKIVAVGTTDLLRDLLKSTNKEGSTAFFLACLPASDGNFHNLNLVLKKIDEHGGTPLLKCALTDQAKDGKNCLFFAVYCRLPLEGIRFIVSKILEAGGKELLKEQLSVAILGGFTPLMFANQFRSANADQTFSFFFQAIVEAGGNELLKHHLTEVKNGEGSPFLLLVCRLSEDEDLKATPCLQLVIDKITEVGGDELLKSQLEASSAAGASALLFSSGWATAASVELIFEKVLAVCGPATLAKQLVAPMTNGFTCLKVAVQYGTTSTALRLVIKNTLEHCGEKALKEQFAAADARLLTRVVFNKKASAEMAYAVAALLVKFDAFEGDYASLSDEEALTRLIPDCVDDSWKPRADYDWEASLNQQ